MIYKISAAALLTAALAAGPVSAASKDQPYTGQQNRDIKALSDKDVADYQAGKGMGFAKAAELNGYPGPRHLLDFKDKFGFTPQQSERLQALFSKMKNDAMALGTRIVAKERELDAMFAGGSATAAGVSAATAEIGRLRGALRAVHLNTHIATKPLLSEAQVARYNALRGYGGAGGGHGAGHGGH